MTQPIFVNVIRNIVPTNGASLAHTTASRVKRKVKKALEKAGYEVETVRGIGIKFSYYGLVYKEENNVLTADFCNKDEMPVKKKRAKGKRSSSRSKKSPLITERDPQTASLSNTEFIIQVYESLPDTWTKTSDTSGKLMSFDIGTLRDTGKSPTDVSKFVVKAVNDHLNVWSETLYTGLRISGRTLLGVKVQ